MNTVSSLPIRLMLTAIALVVGVTSPLLGNNPNGSNPYWNGPTGEVVDMFTGELILAVTDVTIPCRGGMTIAFTRTYNSELFYLDPHTGGRALPDPKATPINLGHGWNFPLVRIVNDDVIIYEDGSYEKFFVDGNGRKKTRRFGVVVYGQGSTNDSLVLQYSDGTRWVFGPKVDLPGDNRYDGRYLIRINDPSGLNHIYYEYYPISGYSTTEAGLLKRISDDAGRYIDLTYDAPPPYYHNSLVPRRLTQLQYRGFNSEVRIIDYDYSDDMLASVQYADGNETLYEYVDHYYDDDEHYFGDSPNDVLLLGNIITPTGARVRFEYEPFDQKWLDRTSDCHSLSELTSDNFGLKHIIYADENDTAVDSVIFIRKYRDGYDLTSQYAQSCSQCSGTEKLVTEYRFYPISELSPSCEPDVTEDLGLPKYMLQFKGAWNAVEGLYTTSASLIEKDSISYEHGWDCQCASSFYSTGQRGWMVAQIANGVYYPYLAGIAYHPRNTDAGYREYPYSGVAFDPDFGVEFASCFHLDSTYYIPWSDGASRDIGNYLYRVLRKYSSGFETHYRYNRDHPTWIDTIYTIRVIKDTDPGQPGDQSFRDSVGVRYERDEANGNIIKVWDDIGFDDDQNWLSYSTYDQTHTFVVSTTTRDGLTTTSDIDPNLGQVNWSESPTGLRTDFYYDDADRLIRTRREGDPDYTAKINYFTDNDRNRKSEVEALSVGGSPSTYNRMRSWTDIWGRPIADTVFNLYRDTPSASDWHSVSFRRYNRLGQLVKSSRPRRDLDTQNDTAWTYYTYDYLGRVTEVNSPNYVDDASNVYENTARTAYDGKYTTTYAWDGRATKTKVDKYGRITDTWYDSIPTGGWKDHGLTEYIDITNLPRTVTSPAGDQITYTYDNWLRVRSITKKDEGTTYGYSDKRGLLRLTRDALGQWMYYRYDQLLRPIEMGTAVETDVDTTAINDLDYTPDNPTIRVKSYYGQYVSPTTEIADTLNARYSTSGTGYNSKEWIRGMPTQVEDEACITYFVFDMYGRTTCKIIQFKPIALPNGQNFSPSVKYIAYSYNLRDQVVQMRHPGATNSQAVQYNYHNSGLLQDVPNMVSQDYQLGFTYNGYGALTSIKYRNWISEFYHYDSLSRLSKVGVTAIVGQQPFAESYSYQNQFLAKVFAESSPTAAPAWNVRKRQYTYDYRNRLQQVLYDATTDTTRVYTYDGLDQKGANNRLKDEMIVNGNVVLRYFYNYYNNSNKLMNVSIGQADPNTQNYTYDAAGRTLTDGAKHAGYRYDYRGMIDSVFYTHSSGSLVNKTDTLIYAYNSQNQRVLKLHNYWYMGDCVGQDPPGEDFMQGDGGGELDGGGGGGDPIQCPRQGVRATLYVWSGNSIIAEYDISDELRYYYCYALGRRIASVYCGSNGLRDTTYNHYDGLGSLRRTTCGDYGCLSMVSQEFEYDPWGNLRMLSGWAPEFTFTGQQWDDDLGINLFYLRNRYYDPAIGRFTTPDPLLSDLNPYSYANNNPVMLVDPSGLGPPYDPNYDETTDGRHPNPFRGGSPYPTVTPTPRTSYWDLPDPPEVQINGVNPNWPSNYGTCGVSAPPDASYFPTGITDFLWNGFGEISGSMPSNWWTNAPSEQQQMYTEAPRFTESQAKVQAKMDAEANRLNGLIWANNAATVGAYGAAKKGGLVGTLYSGRMRYWANTGWGNQHVFQTYKVATIGKVLGYGSSLFGAGLGVETFIESDKSWGDYGALGMTLLSSGLTLGTYTAPIGIGIGIADAFGAFDRFYNYLDIQQLSYNTTGGVWLGSHHFQLR